MKRKSHPFWRFSLDLYGRPGVEAACLALQEEAGADVNLLLFCCWMGTGGRRLDRRFLRRLVAEMAPWQKEVLQPLRQARRAAKTGLAAMPASWRARLREAIAAAELDAEYIEQRVLAGHAAQAARPARKLNPATAVAANLHGYLDLLGLPEEAETRRYVQILLQACG